MVQGVEGSNPFSHPIFSQGFQSLEWVVPSNITGTDPLGHSWATLLLGFRSGLVPEIPSFAPCQGKFLPSSVWSKMVSQHLRRCVHTGASGFGRSGLSSP